MQWQEIKLSCHKQHLEQVEDFLLAEGACSVTYQDAQDQPILEPGVNENPLWDEVVLVALFTEEVDISPIELACEARFSTVMTSPMTTRIFEDKDWVRAWMDDFKPMQFGRRLWICPSWQTPPDENAINIMLDPGLAFGSGTHPTTSMCLQWLDANIIGNEVVVDFGCGSGILAIAAKKLGAKEVIGIDNDPQAIMASHNNAEQNNITEGFEVYLPNDAPQEIKADLVVANILAGILTMLANDIAVKVKESGKIVLSGILVDQVDEIVSTYHQWFDMDAPHIEGDWVRITGTKR